jgi:hypothetical protein
MFSFQTKNAIVFIATHDVDDCLMFNGQQSYGFDCNHSCYYVISNFLKISTSMSTKICKQGVRERCIK